MNVTQPMEIKGADGEGSGRWRMCTVSDEHNLIFPLCTCENGHADLTEAYECEEYRENRPRRPQKEKQKRRREMKLWKLRPIPEKMDQYWTYDCVFGSIVRAETEESARKIAHENQGCEKESYILNGPTTRNDPWLNSELTTCTELKYEGEPGEIMQDFRAG